MNVMLNHKSDQSKEPSLDFNNDKLIQSFKLNDFEQTIPLSKLSIRQNARNFVAYNILALSLSSIGKKKEAEEIFLEGISKNPKNNDLYNNLSNLYLEKRQFKDAKRFSQKAVFLDINCSSSYFTLGIALNACNEIDAAISAIKKSFQLNNKNAPALLQLGNLYKDKKLFSKALDIYRKYQKNFSYHTEGFYNEGCLHLRNERFKVGWDRYDFGLKNDSRFLVKGYHEEENELWDGKPFDGTLLVYGEQGIGDQIIFSTLLYDLKKVQKNIFLKVSKKLVPFFKYNFKDIPVYSEDDKLSRDSYCKFISMGSLCKFFRSNISDFTNTEFKKFSVKRTNIKFKEIFCNNKPVIGISWFTSNFQTGINRSLSIKELKKLINNSECNFVNLQYGDVQEQINDLQNTSKNKVVSIPEIDLTNDINALSNLILNCDLVITIDNTTAHLSSSLGKDTWILLPFSADFKWFEKNTKSLWYETSKLFRQQISRNWDPTINEILNNLKTKYFLKGNYNE